MDFKLSPSGGVGFELAEKTGTSKGRTVETSGVEWVVRRVGTREGIYRATIECQVFSPLSHFILRVDFYPIEQTGEWRFREFKIYRKNLNSL